MRRLGMLLSVVAALAIGYWLLVIGLATAATNVNPVSPDHWGWNDVAGWINFYETNSVTLGANTLEGYASSTIGSISFDCATTPSGNICSAGNGNYKVANDGSGNLSGWAWNDAYGWISFCGGQSSADCPGTIPYRVLVDPTTGAFCDSSSYESCYAWNDVLGWMSFNCKPHDGEPCVGASYSVDTSWSTSVASGTFESATFDTAVAGGGAVHSIFWDGALPSPADSATVSFQVAVSNNSSGPWSFKGFDGTSNTWYEPSAAGEPATLRYDHSGRYFRYKIKLTSNLAQTKSPRVDAVHLVWSR